MERLPVRPLQPLTPDTWAWLAELRHGDPSKTGVLRTDAYSPCSQCTHSQIRVHCQEGKIPAAAHTPRQGPLLSPFQTCAPPRKLTFQGLSSALTEALGKQVMDRRGTR